jgi:hypothetical protein
MTDFVCIEFQANGTTGTPWDALVDLKKHGRYLKDSYDYGLNWANEIVKTMMQQAYKKGLIIESWKKEIVFVIQDVSMKYLEQACDVTGIVDYHKTFPIHFFTFKIIWDNTKKKWTLIFDKKKSSNTDGIRKILSGSSSELYPTIDEFKNSILRKMKNPRSPKV